MADVITKKPVALDQLTIVKEYVDNNNEGSIKGVNYANNTISFYDNPENSGSPLKTISLPEEMVIDLTKSTVVSSFAWSNETYPGSTNPNLDGKPVFVLAVKGDTSVTYSFVTLADIAKSISGDSTTTMTTEVAEGKVKANVKISAQEGNALTVAADGLYVTTNVNANITFATDQEVRDLFNGS